MSSGLRCRAEAVKPFQSILSPYINRFNKITTRSRVICPQARTFISTPARHAINKILPSAAEAIKDMKSNTVLLAGGFGLSGVPGIL